MSAQPTFSAARSAERIARAIRYCGLRPAQRHPENTRHLAAELFVPAMTVDEFIALGNEVEVLR